MVDIERIRQVGDIRKVLYNYGIEPDYKGFIHCLCHNDKHESMRVYDHNCYCWACGATLDIIGVVQSIENCDFRTAVEKVNTICGFSSNNSYMSNSNYSRLIEQRKAEERLQKRIHTKYLHKVKRLRTLEAEYLKIVPKKITDEFRNDTEQVKRAMEIGKAISSLEKWINNYINSNNN